MAKFYSNKRNRNPVLARKTAEDNATKNAFKIFMLLGAMALRDEFEYESDDLQRWIDKMGDILDSYNRGFVDIYDLNSTLVEETGIDVMANKVTIGGKE